jgi:hypothetical protein
VDNSLNQDQQKGIQLWAYLTYSGDTFPLACLSISVHFYICTVHFLILSCLLGSPMLFYKQLFPPSPTPSYPPAPPPSPPQWERDLSGDHSGWLLGSSPLAVYSMSSFQGLSWQSRRSREAYSSLAHCLDCLSEGSEGAPVSLEHGNGTLLTHYGLEISIQHAF